MKPSEFQIDYDVNDPKNIGKPKHFHPDDYCDVVEQLVAADEIIQALKMLDNPPGYYRQYPTDRMVQLKKDILKYTWSMTQYIEDDSECYDSSLKIQREYNPSHEFNDLGDMIDIPFCFPRGPLMIKLVKEYNDKGITPFIWEMGPANFWLPHGLKKNGLKFKYFATSLNKKALEDHKARLKDVWQDRPDNQPEIFVCFEVIEHLWNEQDIRHQYELYGANADHVLISTPLNTLLGGIGDWKRDLGHLRTYSPQDLFESAKTLFPGYTWESFAFGLQVIKGVKNG